MSCVKTQPHISSYKWCTLPLPFWSSAPNSFLEIQMAKDESCDWFFSSLLFCHNENSFCQIPASSACLPWVHSSQLPLFPLVPDTAVFVWQGAQSSGFPLFISLWTWHHCWPLLSLLFEVLSLPSAFPLDRVNPPSLPTPSVGFNKGEKLNGTPVFVLSALFRFS